MITFIAHLKVRPEDGACFEALMTQVRDLTRQHEPGVAYYEFSKSVDEPDTYLVVEVYRNADAHASHMATQWVSESLPKSRRLVAKSQIRQYVGPGTEPVIRQTKDI